MKYTQVLKILHIIELIRTGLYLLVSLKDLFLSFFIYAQKLPVQ